MTDSDPFKLLGINPTSSEEEIDAVFTQRAWEHHPDLGGGNDTMASLNLARQAALKVARARTLVPLSTLQDLAVHLEKHTTLLEEQAESKKKEQNQLAERARGEASIHHVITHRVSPYKQYRYIAAIIGAASAGVGLFGSDEINAVNQLFDQILPKYVSAILVLIGAVLGLVYLVLDNLAKREEQKITEFAKLIDSDFMCFLFLKSTIPEHMDSMVLEDKGRNFIDRDGFEKAFKDWKKSGRPDQMRLGQGKSVEAKARSLHIYDLAEVVLARSVAHGLLEYAPAIINNFGDTSFKESSMAELYSRPTELMEQKWVEDASGAST